MKKIWKVLSIIILAVLILGAVFIGVGMITNADLTRIYGVLDNRWHITMYYEYVMEVIQLLMAQ